MPNHLAWAGALVALSVLSVGRAHAVEPADTPEQVIARVLAAAQAGDVDGVLAYLEADSRSSVVEAFANRAALRQSQEAFREALDERFGPAGELLEPPPEQLETAIGRLQDAEILSRQDGPQGTELRLRTTLRPDGERVETREETVVLRQDEDGWHLVLGVVPEGGRTTRRQSAVQRVIEAIQAGEFQTPQEAMVALAELWSKEEGSPR